MKLTHEQIARLIDRYREVAEQKCANSIRYNLSVNKYGAVQMTDEGAFVECLIWIPKEEL